ncbi:hypothetical protein [Cellulomonas soli]
MAAAGLVMILALRGVSLDGTRQHDEPAPGGETDEAASRDVAVDQDAPVAGAEESRG